MKTSVRFAWQLGWLLGAVVILAPVLRAADIADCKLVPGWQQDGASRHYAADNLFEYLDGGAEGYLLYGFKQLQGVTCASGDNSIVMDLSEMVDSEAAYGIFSSNRDPHAPLQKIGMGGQLMPQRSTFAKGNFYVELTATPDGDHTSALQAFTAALEQRISGSTTPPEQIAWFAPEKLVSVHLVPESVLGLPELRRGYVAEYDQGKAFVVEEASPEAAQTVLGKLRARFAGSKSAPVADEAILAQDKYLDWVCFFRKGKFLGGYTNLPDGPTAQAKASKLVGRLP